MAEAAVTLTSENFDAFVGGDAVLVDFWATWCGPCRMIGPYVEKIAAEGKIKVGKVNVDEASDLAARFRVMTIPTLCIFKNGEIADKLVGANPGELQNMVARNL
nr:thioredoxin [Maliibacterium massiliense]